MSDPLDRLQRALGYSFRDQALLVQALTHRSHGGLNNERLEFLGDGLLNFVVGEAAYRERTSASEGELSRLRAGLVRAETLSQVGRRLQLGELLRLGSGELKSGGFRRDSILADAVEALLGAIYLDGGFDAAAQSCRRIFEPELATLPAALAVKDSKTRLQEALQAQGRPLPDYVLMEESGPPHRRSFVVQCRLADSGLSSRGEGSSRKIAEQAAAHGMMELLEDDERRNA